MNIDCPLLAVTACCFFAECLACGAEAVESSPDIPSKEIQVGLTDGDDHLALQNAVERMAKEGGGIVRIGSGRYRMRNALMLRNNVHVMGTPGETLLVGCASAKTKLARDAAQSHDWIVLTDATGFTVGDGIAIKDDRSPSAFAVTTATLVEQTGPTTFRLSSPLVKDYTVAQNATVSLAFPVVGGWNIKNAVVEGLTIDGNRKQAENLEGCRGAGIYLYACERVTIRNCTVRNYRGDGISFQWGSRGVTIELKLKVNKHRRPDHPRRKPHATSA